MAVKHGPTHADAIAGGQTLVLSDSCSCWCWSRRAAWADSSARVITKVPGRPGFQDRLMIRLLKTRLLFGCHAGRPIFTYRHGIRRACSRFAARAQGSRAREAGRTGSSPVLCGAASSPFVSRKAGHPPGLVGRVGEGCLPWECLSPFRAGLHGMLRRA